MRQIQLYQPYADNRRPPNAIMRMEALADAVDKMLGNRILACAGSEMFDRRTEVAN